VLNEVRPTYWKMYGNFRGKVFSLNLKLEAEIDASCKRWWDVETKGN
jgi:hypothetical protein